MARKVKSKDKISNITIYKIDENFPVDQALSEYKEPENNSGVLNGWSYKIFIRSKTNISPAWQPLVVKMVGKENIPTNSYVSLVIIFDKDENSFALTAGYGYANIREHAIADFGIDIACKALDPNKLDHLYQKVPTGNVYGLNRSLRGKYIPTNDSINQRSVLKALRGKVIDENLGATLEGRKSLAVSGKKNFSDVVSLLDKIVEIEKSQKITVDIKGLEEASKETQEELEKELVEKINEDKFDDVLFGYDDDLVFNNCESLKVGKNKALFPMDGIREIMDEAKKQKPNNIAFVKIIGFDDKEQEIFDKNLIDLIEGEMDYKSNKYFRIDKKWYKTNQKYQDNIKKHFNEIPKISSDYLRPWEKDIDGYVHEGIFLEKNLDDGKILAHTKKVKQIEFADLIDKKNNYLIHVKKGKGAHLRNLFAQGHVSASLFNGDDDFKKEVGDKFDINITNKFTIVFAIFPEEENKIDSIFTLFAKVDLLERYESLRDMGYDVKYCLINK